MRHARVAGIFPNDAAAIRVVGTVLADIHEEWHKPTTAVTCPKDMALLYPNANWTHRRDRQRRVGIRNHP